MSRFALTKGVCELSALLLKGQVLCVCERERDSMLCLHMVRHQLCEAAEQIYHRCSDRRAAQSRWVTRRYNPAPILPYCFLNCFASSHLDFGVNFSTAVAQITLEAAGAAHV